MTYRNPVDQFIADLGGTSSVARALGVWPSVVSGWRTNGNIPKWRIGSLAELATQKGKPFPNLPPRQKLRSSEGKAA